MDYRSGGCKVITQSELKKHLHYNRDTGVFTWERGNLKGKEAGYKSDRYIRITINGKSYAAQRLALLYVDGVMPEIDVDHINQNKQDNAYRNLRTVTRSINMMNAKLSKANTSGVTGVIWDKVNRKWAAQMMVNGKSIKIGRFIEKSDAIKARLNAAKEHGFTVNHGLAGA